MKILKLLSILSFFAYFSTICMAEGNLNIYDFNFTDIDGNKVDLSKFEGKPILLINTASRCGFTPQYEGLQKLFINYRKTKLTIIAITSNSFNQEYSTADEIKKICLVNYNVGFIVSSPIDVKGQDSHPMYQWVYEKYGMNIKKTFHCQYVHLTSLERK